MEREISGSRPTPDSPGTGQAKPDKPEIKLLSLPPAKRSSAGCSTRWAAAGCLGAIAILVAAIISGLLSVDTSFHMMVNRARNRIWNSLPVDLSSEQRMRTLHNLERLPDDISKAPDPNFEVGRFLALAGAALNDRQLTHEEVEELNRHMEAVATGGSQVADPPSPDGRSTSH